MRGHLALRKGASRPLDPRFARFIPDYATALVIAQSVSDSHRARLIECVVWNMREAARAPNERWRRL